MPRTITPLSTPAHDETPAALPAQDRPSCRRSCARRWRRTRRSTTSRRSRRSCPTAARARRSSRASSGTIAGVPLALEAFRSSIPKASIRVEHEDGRARRRRATRCCSSPVTRAALLVGRARRAQLHAAAVGHRDADRASTSTRSTGTNAKILDTRKTTPGWRVLEKYAVRAGGGDEPSHGSLERRADQGQPPRGVRWRRGAGGDARARPGAARHADRGRVRRAEQVRAAIDAGAHIILLDNMSLDDAARVRRASRAAAR